jgi:hypothetical protein
MRRSAAFVLFMIALLGGAFAQEATPTSTLKKRSWFGHIFHPFSSTSLPEYKDPRLRGLTLDLLVTPQIVKLSEVRQLQIKIIVTNLGKRAVTLDFSTDQRIEIYLRNSAETILTKWTENHAITEKTATVLINPQEHVEYNETIATRDLVPSKVFIVEVFFPQYPELNIRQKFMTAQ